jgi:hypothetical protein
MMYSKIFWEGEMEKRNSAWGIVRKIASQAGMGMFYVHLGDMYHLGRTKLHIRNLLSSLRGCKFEAYSRGCSNY